MSDRNSWNWSDDYSMAWSATDDPRIAAVIQRDDNAPAPDFGAPALLDNGYGSRAHFEELGMSDNGARLGWIEAYERAGESFADRFVSVFYGATAHHMISSVDRYSWVIVFDCPEWRADHGIEPGTILSRADITGDMQAWLDSEVYGVGYAVSAARVTEESEFDFESPNTELTIECWGFYGEEYAMHSALDFECGSPELETLIDWSNN